MRKILVCSPGARETYAGKYYYALAEAFEELGNVCIVIERTDPNFFNKLNEVLAAEKLDFSVGFNYDGVNITINNKQNIPTS